MISRRQFCQTMSGLAVAGLWLRPRIAAGAPADLEFTQLRDNAWAITGGGGNSLLVKGNGRRILIDTKYPTVGSELRLGCDEVAGDAPLVIINTHHHPDHVGSTFRFRRDPVTADEVVAHENLAPRLTDVLEERLRGALREQADELEGDEARDLRDLATALTVADFAPTLEYAQELDLERGGVKLQLRYHGNAHTDNDTIVVLPDLELLHMGDLVFHEVHPYIDHSAGADTRAWQGVLKAAEQYCDGQTTLIPGHGEISDRTALVSMSEYFDELRRVVREAIAEGKSREAITELAPTAFPGRGFEQLGADALGKMYDELTG